MIYSEIKHQPERSKTYLGSPAIIRLPDGVLVASHDYFGGEGSIKDINNNSGLTSIYRSEDNGTTWENVTHICNAWQGTLFLHKGDLYFLSTSYEYGDLVIRKSTDGGFTWTVPTDEHNGFLFKAGKGHENPNFHAPGNRVSFYNNRVWKAVEDLYYNGTDEQMWQAPNFQTFVISASLDDDLMEASSWICSNKVRFEDDKFPEHLKFLLLPHDSWCKGSGWLEGNIIADPDGKLHNMIRVHLAEPNKAMLLDLSDDGKTLTCNYEKAVVEFVGGGGRFIVQKDPVTNVYFSLANYRSEGEIPSNRNTLELAGSEDLIHWYNLGTILSDDTGFSPEMSMQFTGFQYVDWLFDGEDIIYLSRTAYRGANNFHNSNRITYHVLKNFRSYWEKRPARPVGRNLNTSRDGEFMKNIAVN